jgi:uncharacterized protein YjcR
MQQKEKLNELIGAIHEKDELLDSQEEFLIKENKKHVKVKNAYAQEVEKMKIYLRSLELRMPNYLLRLKREMFVMIHLPISNRIMLV